MSQFLKGRPLTKTMIALAASCVPLYVASQSIGPSYGKLIDLKMKDEAEQLRKENAYDPNAWKVKFLDSWKQTHNGRYDDEAQDRFAKKIANAAGETPKGFENDYKTGGAEQDSADVQKEADEAANTPDADVKEISGPTTSDSSDSGSDSGSGSDSAEDKSEGDTKVDDRSNDSKSNEGQSTEESKAATKELKDTQPDKQDDDKKTETEIKKTDNDSESPEKTEDNAEADIKDRTEDDN